MKTKYAIEFIATPSQISALMSDDTFSGLLMLAMANGTQPEWASNLSATRYRFLSGGADNVPDTALEALISAGVITLFGGSGIYIEVADSVLDNLVPTAWTDAREPSTYDDEGNETVGDRRDYQNYTQVIQGENGTSLLRCGYIPNGMSGFVGYTPDKWEDGLLDTVDTPEIIALYQEEFPDTTLYYHNSFSTWEEANITTD